MSSAASRRPAWAMALSRSNSAWAFLVSVRRAAPAMPSAEPRMASDAVVGGIEVGALPVQLVVTEHGSGP